MRSARAPEAAAERPAAAPRARTVLRRATRPRSGVLALLLLALLVGPMMGTRSAYVLARSTGSTARTPPLIFVGPATAKATSPQNYTITGLAPGASTDYLVNLANDGTASFPALDLDATTTTSSALDTDSSLGLRIEVTWCSLLWQQSAPGAAATCAGSTSTLLGPATLASLTASLDAQVTSGIASMSTGGRDHLRVEFSLPGGAPAGYSALTSSPRLYVWGAAVPGAPTGLTLTPGDGLITGSWTAPASNGSAITGYTLTASPGGATCSSASTSCTISGLTDGLTYTLSVTATNSLGTSAASTSASAIPYPAILTGAGNVLWLDGADSATLFQNTGATTPVTAAGQSVAAWKDKSGQHNDVAAPSTAPVEDASTYTHPSVTFTTGRYLEKTSGFPTNSDYTEAVVYRPSSVSGSSSCYGNVLSGSASGRAFYLAGGAGLTLWHNSDTIAAPGGAGASANTSFIGTGSFTTSSLLATVDVNAQASASKTLAYQSSDAGIQVGAFMASFGFCGQVAEAAVWSRVLTAAEKRTLQEYLGRKWVTVITPTAPTAPSATRGNAQAAISWTAPSYNGGASVSSYTATAAPGGATCTSASTSCTITGLTNGTAYTVSVTATNTAGASLASTSVAVTPGTVPGAPTGVGATNGDTTSVVTWTAPASNGGYAITGYTASAVPTDNTLSTQTCAGGAGATTCTITGLIDGASYTVSVTATNAIGTGTASSTVTILPYPTALITTANLGAWFDASDTTRVLNSGGTSATNGQNVQTVNDRSGNGVNVTQATAGNQMTLGTLNGRQALSSASADYYTSSATGTFRTVVSAGAATASVWNTTFAAPANTDFSQRLLNNALPAGNVNDWHYNGFYWVNSVPSSATATTSSSVFVSEAVSNQTSKTASLSTSFNGRGFTGALGEVIAFNRVLSSTERRTTEEYLARKWGATLTPQAPTLTAVTKPSSGQLTATWTAPAWNGGSAITGYTATATPGGQTCTAAAGATSCTITGLTASSTYGVSVTATNSVGVGVASNSINGTA